MPKQQSAAIVEQVFGTLVDHLKGGDRVRIIGLGNFEVKNRPACVGRNPATGETVQIKVSKKTRLPRREGPKRRHLAQTQGAGCMLGTRSRQAVAGTSAGLRGRLTAAECHRGEDVGELVHLIGSDRRDDGGDLRSVGMEGVRRKLETASSGEMAGRVSVFFEVL